MPPSEHVMMQIFWRKHNLFKNSFYFKIEASLVPQTKTHFFFKIRFIFPKIHIPFFIFFWLKVPKNWWSLLEIFEWDINLKIWWSDSKDLFSPFGQRDGTCSKPFSRNKNSLKIKHLKKIHFSSPSIWEFDSRQDSSWQTCEFENALLDRKFKFFDFGKDWGTRGGFRYFLVVDPSFVCLLRPWVF